MKHLAIALGLVAAGAAAATLMSVGTAGAGSPSSVQTVREQNVDAQGNIKVHEQGTPQVSLTGDSRVGLDPTLGNTVKIDADQNTVKIDAAGSGPIQTQSTDNPAFSPVVANVGLPLPATVAGSGHVVYTVPTGHELVIEQVSFEAELNPGEQLARAEIAVVGGGQSGGFDLPPTTVGSGTGEIIGTADIQTRIYADPGTDVQCVVVRNGGFSAAAAMCSISGYLVPTK